ncbi:MAG: LuxR C-terminal-related transcriptional regulator [candidate division KSB1 bacterium]|nr:LuxR C-terminal-related transcriptional regulator [candidate division KSB1 bacterium]
MNAESEIVIIESSEIIQEGLIRIVRRALPEFQIVCLASFKEFESRIATGMPKLIIVNTELLKQGFLNVFKNQTSVKKVGLITHFFNREQENIFDDLIYLSDSSALIEKIVKSKFTYSETANRNESLSNRELDVLKLLVKGYPNKQIAAALHISVHTVVSHRKNISAKLGIKSIAGLAIMEVINNIIDVDDYLDVQ